MPFYFHIFQQQSLLPEQPQFGSLPVSQPLIMAAAHPTLALTEIAFTGQFIAQAPHSIQLFLSFIRALLSVTLNTP
jgi:hypothetical protein